MAATTDQTEGPVVFVPSEAVAARTRDKAFRSAQYHSRMVKLLKIGLPLAAIAMATAFFGWSYVSSPVVTPVAAEGSVFSDGKLVMANPKLEGFTKENLPYSMKALRAVQDVDKGGVIELEGIDARLPMDTSNWATVTAPNGIYDRDRNTLDISGKVTVVTTDGLEADLKSASLDIDKGNLKTSDPVDIRRAGSRITSDSMTIVESGKVLLFEKRVRVHIDPTRMNEAQANGGQDAKK